MKVLVPQDYDAFTLCWVYF